MTAGIGLQVKTLKLEPLSLVPMDSDREKAFRLKPWPQNAKQPERGSFAKKRVTVTSLPFTSTIKTSLKTDDFQAQQIALATLARDVQLSAASDLLTLILMLDTTPVLTEKQQAMANDLMENSPYRFGIDSMIGGQHRFADLGRLRKALVNAHEIISSLFDSLVNCIDMQPSDAMVLVQHCVSLTDREAESFQGIFEIMFKRPEEMQKKDAIYLLKLALALALQQQQASLSDQWHLQNMLCIISAISEPRTPQRLEAVDSVFEQLPNKDEIDALIPGGKEHRYDDLGQLKKALFRILEKQCSHKLAFFGVKI